MGNRIKIDDLGVPLFLEPPTWVYLGMHSNWASSSKAFLIHFGVMQRP